MVDADLIDQHRERGSLQAKILLIDSDESSRTAVSGWLCEAFPALMVIDGLEAPPRNEGELEVDICIAHLSDGGTEELRLAVDHARGGVGSIVLWADSMQCPQVAAAHVLGIRRILRKSDLCTWIERALPALVRQSRAAKDLQRSLREIPPVPQWSAHEPSLESQPMALTRAETLFRESYVKHLLAKTGSRKRAAEIAGVPYRTFCHILKKLDIR